MKERLIWKWAWDGFCIGLDVFNNTSLSLAPLLTTTIYRCDDTGSLGLPFPRYTLYLVVRPRGPVTWIEFFAVEFH